MTARASFEYEFFIDSDCNCECGLFRKFGPFHARGHPITLGELQVLADLLGVRPSGGLRNGVHVAVVLLVESVIARTYLPRNPFPPLLDLIIGDPALAAEALSETDGFG